MKRRGFVKNDQEQLHFPSSRIAPFRIEITNKLQKGEKTLEVKVVNLRHQRVAGDQSFPAKKQYTQTNIMLGLDFRGRPIDEIPLEPSGLLGPVPIKEAVIE